MAVLIVVAAVVGCGVGMVFLIIDSCDVEP